MSPYVAFFQYLTFCDTFFIFNGRLTDRCGSAPRQHCHILIPPRLELCSHINHAAFKVIAFSDILQNFSLGPWPLIFLIKLRNKNGLKQKKTVDFLVQHGTWKPESNHDRPGLKKKTLKRCSASEWQPAKLDGNWSAEKVSASAVIYW